MVCHVEAEDPEAADTAPTEPIGGRIAAIQMAAASLEPAQGKVAKGTQRGLTVLRCCARVVQQPTQAGKNGIKGMIAPPMRWSVRNDEVAGGNS